MAILPWLVMPLRKVVLVLTTNDFMKNMNTNENLKNVDPDWSQQLKRLLLILKECKAINQVQLMKSIHTYLENTIWNFIEESFRYIPSFLKFRQCVHYLKMEEIYRNLCFIKRFATLFHYILKSKFSLLLLHKETHT